MQNDVGKKTAAMPKGQHQDLKPGMQNAVVKEATAKPKGQHQDLTSRMQKAVVKEATAMPKGQYQDLSTRVQNAAEKEAPTIVDPTQAQFFSHTEIRNLYCLNNSSMVVAGLPLLYNTHRLSSLTVCRGDLQGNGYFSKASTPTLAAS